MAEDTRREMTATARTVCDMVRSTLGPFGANKLMIGSNGDVTTTSVGSILLDRLDVEDPTVSVLAGAAEDFADRHGDGTATVVALAGALLEGAEELIDMGVHPTTIDRGYREALSVATDRLAAETHPTERVGTAAVAESALTATRDPFARERVGGFIADVAATLLDAHGDGALDRDRVGVIARLGGGQLESELIAGAVLDREPVSEGMPRTVEGAGVALLSSTIDVRRIGTETDRTKDVRLSIDAESFEDRAAIGDWEREAFRESLGAAVDAGCGFVATRRSVNDRVKTVLSNYGVLAIQRVDEPDMDRLVRLTGARVVPHLDDVTTETLGRAGVAVRRVAGRDLTVIESEENDPVYTVFVRAPDPRAADAFERSVESALAAVRSAIRGPGVVAGGGAIEASAARAVRDHARSIDRREQLAVEAFADALATVPRTLARNAGLDGQDALTRLYAAHDGGDHAVGVDALDGALRDVLAGDPIVDPAGSKRAIWSAATDLAVQLVRIDEQLPATELEDEDAEAAVDRYE